MGRRSLDGGSDGAEADGVQQRVLSTILNELDGVDTGYPFSPALSRLRRHVSIKTPWIMVSLLHIQHVFIYNMIDAMMMVMIMYVVCVCLYS